MKDQLVKYAKHPLIGGSSIIFLGTFAANFINYIFNVLMGRMLSVSEYGLLVSLNTLFVLVGIFSVSFVSLITKFSAKYHSTDNTPGAQALINYGSKFILSFAGLLLIVLIVFIPVISTFLKIENYWYIFLIEISIFFSIILALPTGYFQGALRFYTLTGITIIQPIIRLIISVGLIVLGYAVFGPLIGIVLSGVIPVVILFLYLFRKKKEKNINSSFNLKEFKEDFFHYTYTYFLAGIGLTLLSNSDILLVRHFFTADISGQYAALSLMGKAILYFTAPVTTVFFPVIAQKKEKKEKLLRTVLFASSIVVGVSGVLAVGYFLVPNLVLKVFFPRPGYLILAHYLGYFALYILVFSLASLLNSYFLSIGKTKVYIITLVAAAVQIAGISVFHNTLYDVITSLFISSLIMLLLLLIYYFKNGEHH